MPGLPWRVAWLVFAIIALAVGAVTEQAATSRAVSFERQARPRITNRCPVGALLLRRADLPALRLFGLELAPHGVQKAGSRSIDYRDAHARTADVAVGYPHVTWIASLSSSLFLISRTRHGLVGWAQMH